MYSADENFKTYFFIKKLNNYVILTLIYAMFIFKTLKLYGFEPTETNCSIYVYHSARGKMSYDIFDVY